MRVVKGLTFCLNVKVKSLCYPYNFDDLATRFQEIGAEVKKRSVILKRTKVAILGGVTTAHIKNYLELFLLKRGIAAEFYESPYNQYFQEAVSGSEALEKFQPEFTIVYTSTRNLPTTAEARSVQEQMTSLKSVWAGIKKQTQSVIIQNNFEYPATRVFGNMDGALLQGEVRFVRELNEELANAIGVQRDVLLHDMNYLSSLVGLEQWHDPDFWHLYKYASSLKSFPFIADSLSAVIAAYLGLSKKVLVLDADNTLWGGEVGEVGAQGVALDEATAEGESFRSFQDYCLKLKNRGVLLGLLSKNDVAVVEQAFALPQSRLAISDFSASAVNWDRKDHNMVRISEQLNLPLGSMVFVDDNPTESALIQKSHPEVEAPLMNEFSGRFAEVIDRNYFFETAGYSDDDRMRSANYANDQMRKQSEKNFVSYEEFLKSLELSAMICSNSEKHRQRMVQLTNKTNQFNLNGRKISENQLASYESDPSVIVFGARLKDKFGDHGLVSAVIGVASGKSLRIESWVMSCRVIGKELEYVMLDELVRRARLTGFDSLIGEYRPSGRNDLVKDHYEKMGFSLSEPRGDWKLNLQDYKQKNRYIGVAFD